MAATFLQADAAGTTVGQDFHVQQHRALQTQAHGHARVHEDRVVVGVIDTVEAARATAAYRDRPAGRGVGEQHGFNFGRRRPLAGGAGFGQARRSGRTPGFERRGGAPGIGKGPPLASAAASGADATSFPPSPESVTAGPGSVARASAPAGGNEDAARVSAVRAPTARVSDGRMAITGGVSIRVIADSVARTAMAGRVDAWVLVSALTGAAGAGAADDGAAGIALIGADAGAWLVGPVARARASEAGAAMSGGAGGTGGAARASAIPATGPGSARAGGDGRAGAPASARAGTGADGEARAAIGGAASDHSGATAARVGAAGLACAVGRTSGRAGSGLGA